LTFHFHIQASLGRKTLPNSSASNLVLAVFFQRAAVCFQRSDDSVQWSAVSVRRSAVSVYFVRLIDCLDESPIGNMVPIEKHPRLNRDLAENARDLREKRTVTCHSSWMPSWAKVRTLVI